jgi:hypothetical protein
MESSQDSIFMRRVGRMILLGASSCGLDGSPRMRQVLWFSRQVRSQHFDKSISLCSSFFKSAKLPARFNPILKMRRQVCDGGLQQVGETSAGASFQAELMSDVSMHLFMNEQRRSRFRMIVVLNAVQNDKRTRKPSHPGYIAED